MCPTSVSQPQQAGLLPEPLFDLRTLGARGYGCRNHLLTLIRRGELPAVKVGKAFKVRESDLHYLAVPIQASSDGAEQ